MGKPCYRTKDATGMDRTSTRMQKQPHDIWEPAVKRMGNMEKAEPGERHIVSMRRTF